MCIERKEVILLAEQEMAKRCGGPSSLERKLWNAAINAPYGNKLIPGNAAGDPYLLRTYMTPDRNELFRTLYDMGIRNELMTRAITAARPYLHYFFRGDEDREVHNHPWSRSVSLILTGGYKEYRWMPLTREFETRYLRPGNLNFIKRNDFHRVELYNGQGCWTLFLSMGRVMESNGRDWSFLNTDTNELIPWGEWVHH